jgi:hypothetical protein
MVERKGYYWGILMVEMLVLKWVFWMDDERDEL